MAYSKPYKRSMHGKDTEPEDATEAEVRQPDISTFLSCSSPAQEEDCDIEPSFDVKTALAGTSTAQMVSDADTEDAVFRLRGLQTGQRQIANMLGRARLASALALGDTLHETNLVRTLVFLRSMESLIT